MRELEYPFDAELLLKKKRSIKKQLLSDASKSYINKKIAILGGATTQNIKVVLVRKCVGKIISLITGLFLYLYCYGNNLHPSQSILPPSAAGP